MDDESTTLNDDEIESAGDDPAATAADDFAVAPDKSAWLPGSGPATFANVTSYARGINGVMIDIAGLPQGVTLAPDDFSFRSGRTPGSWNAYPAPASVAVRRGAGVNGSDRVTLVWPDYNPAASPLTTALANGWLEVTIKANADTGLAAPDVFFFGNLIGETGDGTGAAEWRASALDLATVKRALNTDASPASATDFNRDGRTNALDLATVRRALNRALPAPAPPADLTGRAADRSLAEELGLVS